MKGLSVARIVVLLGLMAVFAAPGVASAANWQSNGSIGYTLYDAGASRWIITPTSGSAVSVNCTASMGTGTMAASPALGTNPWLDAMSLTPVYAGCTVSGAGGYSISCSAAWLSVSSYSGPTSLPGLGGVSLGTLTSYSCTLKFGTTTCSAFTGSMIARYANPANAGSSGILTIQASGQSLRAAGTGCAAVPVGSLQYGKPSGTTVTDISFSTVSTGTNAPNAVKG